MNHKNKKHIIVVLGMHRSGTSAITRGLQALGIDLGDNLIPPISGNNEKGFYEDVEINNLNNELMNALDIDWQALSFIPVSAFEQERILSFKLRAIELIRVKMGDTPFGLKDPRIARLLPFWQMVFDHLNLTPFYVIAVRHPMSVMKSLQKRDGFENEKGYYLWLQHVISIISGTVGSNRVIVDFDFLISDPKKQLKRIAQAFDLAFNPDSGEVKEYIDEFLDGKLRHTKFELGDLRIDPALPLDVVDAYELLTLLARDEVNIDAPVVNETFSQLSAQLMALTPALNYMTRSDRKIEKYEQQVANLNQAMTERDEQIATLNQAVAEREGQIATLNQAVAEQDGQIANLNQAVDAKETHIRNLAAINLLERDAHAANINQALAELRQSTSWRLTAPIRLVGHQLLRMKMFVRAVPYARAMCGGFYGLLEHVWSTYKKEGVSGIKRRIAFSASPGAPPPAIDYVETNHSDYTEWVRRYDTLTDTDRERINARISQLPNAPLISIVMPVYNPPLNMLKEAIQSVQNQLYSNWELCIADDASTDNAVRELLQSYADKDFRIKVVFRKQNGHISAASNSALEIASGDYIALLDNDDLLREHALFFVAQAIAEQPDAGLIYSDEDKIDQSGKRYAPYFKPDWNPDLFLSHNMICHLGVYRADLVKKLGGFREGYEGAQDYDLALRCTEQLATKQIVHIPRVLYHWRSHPGSTAQAGSEKNYALTAGERALNDHFSRIAVSAKAELLDFGMYRARYNIPKPAPLVSLIIPTRNGLNLIKQCVVSILDKTTYQNYEILIVDNNSDDPQTLEYFSSLAGNNRIRVLRDERPFNYSALNNAAVLHARGEYLGLINNDIEVITPEWLDEMVCLTAQPGVGAVGARLWYPNDTLQHGGCITGVGGVAGHSHKHLPKGRPGYFCRAQLIQTLSVVTAACLVIKKSIYQEVGGLDEINLKVAFNDVDFCLRVREAGYRNVWTPYAELYHHESATRGYEDTPEKQLRFRDEVLYMQKRWGDILLHDPAYSPNLTLDREDFSYAWPPRVQPLVS